MGAVDIIADVAGLVIPGVPSAGVKAGVKAVDAAHDAYKAADALHDASKVADATKTIVKNGDNILDAADAAKDLKKASNIADAGKDSSKALTQAKNVFPNNPDDLLPEIPRNKVVKSNGTTSQTIHTSDRMRIRAEKHPLEPGDIYNPRHHGTHYHVEYRIDVNKSWNNPRNVRKVHPNGYTPGGGTGFLPGETFPGTNSRR